MYGIVWIYYGSNHHAVVDFIVATFLADTKIAQLIIYCIVVLAGFSWVEWIYHRRGKTVMKHYSKRSFYPIIGILLFLIPFAIIFTMAYYFNMLFRN